MDEDDRELVNRLLATATAMLEDAVDLAAAGQSAKLGRRQLSDRAKRLHAIAQEIAVVAEAAAIAANIGINQPRNKPKTRR